MNFFYNLLNYHKYFFKKYKNTIINICIFFWFLFLFIIYVNFNFYNIFYLKLYNTININSFLYTFDSFEISLLVYNILITYFCVYYVFNKIIINNIYTIFFIITITIFTIILFTTNDIYMFFLSYEFILLPSVFLVYVSSPNMRAKFISFYFLFWTQFGSFLFFIVIIIFFNNSINFNNTIINFNIYYKYLITLLLFFGFGIKIPIWPFHFWLTKTHVEVNTAFSIFLSGVLVKIAIYGFYKFFFIMQSINCIFFIIITFLGIIDITLKLPLQTDFKKIIAYCTIFEMNIILINVFFFSFNTTIYILLFCILHTTLSCVFFLISDFLYKRYNTRCILNIGGVFNNCSSLSTLIVISVIFFNGIPFTLKFNLEISIFLKLYNYDIVFLTLFIFSQIIFIIFFTKIIYSVLFNNTEYSKVIDISLYESLLIIFNLIVLVLI